MTSPVSAALHAAWCVCASAAIASGSLIELRPILAAVARLSALIGVAP